MIEVKVNEERYSAPEYTEYLAERLSVLGDYISKLERTMQEVSAILHEIPEPGEGDHRPWVIDLSDGIEICEVGKEISRAYNLVRDAME
jgi:hypothetical protein